MSSPEILSTIAIFAVMGMVGQGVRAIVGLKSAATQGAQDATKQVEFNAAYFGLSLMIGAVAGIVGGFALGLNDAIDVKTLLALAASGYGGTDFIENAFTNFLPGITKPQPGLTANAESDSVPKSPSSGSAAGNGTTSPTDSARAPVTVDEVRQTANAAAAVVKSTVAAFAGLGQSPLTILHQAADGVDGARSLLASTVEAYATLSASARACPGLAARAASLEATPSDASPQNLSAAKDAAEKLMGETTQISQKFNDALANFREARIEILKITAKG